MRNSPRSLVGLLCIGLLNLGSLAGAAEAEKTFQVAGGKLSMEVPADWKVIQPRVRIIEHEFSAPAVEGDSADGRVTVMGAGGSVEENIDRWIGQFSQPDGGSTKERAKIEKKTIAGQEVHLVDLAGAYADRPAPFLPQAIERPDYRMLAAIIMTEADGNYFVKFYGPAKTVAAHEQAFHQMIGSLTVR